ncbi:MAG: hypothetical protein V4666_08390 [Bacteroidota bacterium]
MSWTKADLQKLKDKGLFIEDNTKVKEIEIKAPKSVKVSIEKNTIELYLKQMVQSGLIEEYKTEFQFTKKRKFRFDWFIPCLNLAIEYEGIMSSKSRHTTISGYTGDINKYNLALALGFKVLRYNALNYQNAYSDIEKIKNLS